MSASPERPVVGWLAVLAGFFLFIWIVVTHWWTLPCSFSANRPDAGEVIQALIRNCGS